MEENRKVDQTIKVDVEQKKKKKKKMGAHKTAKLILIVGLVIIAIPCICLGIILIQASKATGNPVNGSRFNNGYDPQIVETDISCLETSIQAMSNVESVEVNLTTGQLRISVDVKDSLNNEEVEEIARAVYEKVNSKLPTSKYFTSTSSNRMYDLAINVYNFADSDKEGMACWNVQKNGQMKDVVFDSVTTPKNEELVKELRGETDEEDTENSEESGETE